MAPLTTAPWLLHLLAAAAAAACCAGTGTTTTPATAAAAAATAGGLASELRELAQLFQAGALDEPEFTAAKQAVINAAAAPPPPPPPPPHGPFNVVDFGADPSGKSDSTAAIQAAILAASKTYILRDCGNHGCGRSVADVYVPAGLYVLSATIELGIAPGIHGEGTAMLHQTNSSADIFYSSHVWRTQISGLHFLSGQNHLHLGTDNVDNSFIIVAKWSGGAVAIQCKQQLQPAPTWMGVCRRRQARQVESVGRTIAISGHVCATVGCGVQWRATV